MDIENSGLLHKNRECYALTSESAFCSDLGDFDITLVPHPRYQATRPLPPLRALANRGPLVDETEAEAETKGEQEADAETEAEAEAVDTGGADGPVAIAGVGTPRGVAKRRCRKADFLIVLAEAYAKVSSVGRK